MGTLNNSEWQTYSTPRDDDSLRPYTRSDNKEDLKYAKAGYELLQNEISQGYHVSGVTRQDCEREIKTIKEKLADE